VDVRLEPKDEYLHELGPEPTFNESMYFNVIDPDCGVGAFFRLGNRANEGRGEMTCCVYLPDGRVAFMFRRPEVTTNDAFDAAGMRFDVVTPFEELRVRYSGSVVVLTDPMAMSDPKTAFTENPSATASVDLVFRGTSVPFGGEPTESHERPGEEFARGHYEQLVGARGTGTVGDEQFDLDGYGLRDHSWGPRTWQAPWYYRWLVGCGGPDVGFMASRIARRDSDGTRGGFVWWDGEMHLLRHVEVHTDWTDDGGVHRHVTATLHTARPGEGEGSGGVRPPRSWTLDGEVLNLIPLRNRREGLVTRISEGLTRWTLTPDDGGEARIAHGLSEYLDQIIDGRPVGIDE